MTTTMKALLTLLVLVWAAPADAQVIRYYHTDITGSVVAVTDENANVIERRVYEPYGLPQTPIPDGPGYTGHDMDGETGLVYMQQRYYDPLVGRFLSVDPMAVNTATAWNFNRYNYAANNPYLYTDPDGRAAAACVLPGIMQVCIAAAVKAVVVIGAVGSALGIVKTAGEVNHALNEIGEGAAEPSTTDSEEAPPAINEVEGKRPFQGEPGSISRGSDGTRRYGDDGYPETDRDPPHRGERGVGGSDHVHDWGRPEGGGRPTHKDRGESVPPRPGDPPPARPRDDLSRQRS